MKAQALVVTAINKVELQSVRIPEPQAGEVILETLYSCVSPGTELRCLSGGQPDAKVPFIPGYAMVGRVAARGPGVTVAEGTLFFCMGTTAVQDVNLAWGSHMSHVVTSVERLLPIPEGVDLIQASASKLASIPYHGLRLCHPLPEEKIAIIGLGPIGHMAAKLYTQAGAHAVACDRMATRVAGAKKAGIEAVVAGPSLRDTFRAFFPDGADVIVDCTGVPAVLPAALELCREFPWGNHQMSGPRYVLQGSYVASFSIPYTPAFLREMSFVVPRSEQDRDRTIILDMLRRGVLSLKSVISDVRKPVDGPATYAQLQDPKTELLTVVFTWKD